jgi:hypothetical protein
MTVFFHFSTMLKDTFYKRVFSGIFPIIAIITGQIKEFGFYLESMGGR